MKHIKYFFVLAVIVLLTSCGQNNGNFELKGRLENAANKQLVLLEMTAYEIEPFDTINLDENGHFQMKGNIEQPRFFVLSYTNTNQIFLLVHPGEKINIQGDLLTLKDSYSVEGSEDSELVRILNAQMNKTITRLDSLSRYYQENINQPDKELEALRAQVRLEFEQISNLQRDFTLDFITKNPSSLASLMALYQQIDPQNFVLNREEDFKHYVMVDSVLLSIYPDLDYTKTLHENVTEMLSAIAFSDQTDTPLSIGAVAPDIELPNPEGKVIKLSSLRGQYVLLDFWAAWCAPCRHENPYLVDVYEKFNSKGFTIYQVSLDRTKDAWVKGINDDKIGKWSHVSDLQFWNSSVVPVYQIEGIPANFLLDKEGKIIARNLRGEALGAKLAEIFN